MTYKMPTNSAVESRLIGDSGFSWDGQVGGEVPVLVEFTVDGFHGAFRSRGTHWSFIVAISGVIDPADENEELFKIESYYDKWPNAGYMTLAKAFEFVETSVAAFRAIQTIPK